MHFLIKLKLIYPSSDDRGPSLGMVKVILAEFFKLVVLLIFVISQALVPRILGRWQRGGRSATYKSPSRCRLLNGLAPSSS